MVMKDFFNFLSEARKTKASEKARQLGLTGDGQGNWVNKSGNIVAKTEDGVLVFTQRKTKGVEGETSKDKKVKSPEQQSRKSVAQPDESGGREGGEDEEDTKSGNKDGETLTLVFGRFNPPTIGHKKLLDNASQISSDGDLRIYPSRSNDPKKNPLDPDQKSNLMRKMFPDHSDSIINDSGVKTIFDALKIASNDGYSNIKIVVGSDRVSEFDSLAQKYNGQLYSFDEIETISAGQRDDDATDVSGMSASKLRKAAAENDFESFRKGIPDNIDDKDAKVIMNTVRKAMKVTTTEGWNLWEIAPKFDWKNLRENYVTGKIFKMNQLVENLNTGLVGKIVRRGTNYLICVTEQNIMFKSWIRDLREYTEVKMDSKTRVKGKPNTLSGTTGYFKYVSDMTPGFEKGDKTNLQSGAKPYKGPKTNFREFLNRYKNKSV
tara:strand:+ start:784 stop:2085 length:1302 start_codon:yes stop_codon:yes gene_type:complete